MVLPYTLVTRPADTHGPRRVLSLFLDLATYRATSVASFCLGLALKGGLR